VADQLTFAAMAWQSKGKTTKRERFLAEMNVVVPWASLVAIIEPYYPKAGNGTQPYPLELMLRIHCLQHWFNLSDPAAEEALYDSEAMRRFAHLELGVDRVPDETTILRFRHLLEAHALAEILFREINGQLEGKGLLLRSGTIVDATIIAAPSSTKNATETRDPEMHQTKKGNQWHFGMKFHAGMDPNGIVHTLTATAANTADITEMPDLLHGSEETVWGDAAYWKEEDRRRLLAAGTRYRINRRGTKQRPLTDHQQRVNRSRSRTRAKGEHGFHVVKCLWGFVKVRYRGLGKNLSRGFVAFGLANLYRLRRRLLPPTFRPCLT
jgi:IS5 family transposase